MSQVRLKFKVNQEIPREIHPLGDVNYFRTKKCDWAKLFKKRLEQQYPDMIITREEDGTSYLIEFKNRPTSIGDVKVRFHEFLRNTPAMKVSNLELNSIPQ